MLKEAVDRGEALGAGRGSTDAPPRRYRFPRPSARRSSSASTGWIRRTSPCSRRAPCSAARSATTRSSRPSRRDAATVHAALAAATSQQLLVERPGGDGRLRVAPRVDPGGDRGRRSSSRGDSRSTRARPTPCARPARARWTSSATSSPPARFEEAVPACVAAAEEAEAALAFREAIELIERVAAARARGRAPNTPALPDGPRALADSQPQAAETSSTTGSPASRPRATSARRRATG